MWKRTINIILFCGLLLACRNKQVSETNSNYRAFFNTLNATDYPQRKVLIDSLTQLYHDNKNFTFYDELERKRIFRYYYQFTAFDYAKAILYNDSIQEQLKDHLENEYYAQKYVESLWLQGDNYLKAGAIDECIFQYSLATYFGITYIKDTCKANPFLERRARLFYSLHQYRLASIRFKEFLAAMRNCNDYQENTFHAINEGYLRLIDCYTNRNMMDSALIYVDSIFTFYRKYDLHYKEKKSFVERNRHYAYNSLANIFAKTNRPDEADSLYSKTLLEMPMIREDSFYLQFTMLQYAELLFDQKKLSKADSVLSVFTKYQKNFPDSQMMFQYYKLRLRQCKQFDGALCKNYQDRYNSIATQLNAEREHFKNADLSSMLDLKIAELKNKVLNVESYLKSSYILIGFVLTAIFAVVILFILRNYRRSKKFIFQLSTINKKITLDGSHLQEAYMALQKSYNDNDRFVKVVSQDLKNTISGVKLMASISQRKENQDGFIDAFKTIEIACVDSLSVIQKVLEEHKQTEEINKDLINLPLSSNNITNAEII